MGKMIPVLVGMALGMTVMYSYFRPSESKAFARSALHTLSDTASDGVKAADAKLAK